MEGKGPDGKERASTKKPKGTAGTAGLAGGKVVESGKATSGSGNDGASQRCADLCFGFLLLTIFRFFSSFYICSKEEFLPTLPCYLNVNFLLYSGESGSEGSSDGSDDNANNQVCMCITANYL